jgi:hypothetical protein
MNQTAKNAKVAKEDILLLFLLTWRPSRLGG